MEAGKSKIASTKDVVNSAKITRNSGSRKPRGMRNINNTCFAISAFQFIYHYPGFVKDCLQIPLTEKNNAAKIVQNLMQSLSVPTPNNNVLAFPLNPVEMRRLCDTMGFKLNVHHDGVEFFHQILQTISQQCTLVFQILLILMNEPVII